MGIDIDKLDNNNVPQAQIGLLTPPLSPNEPFEFPGGGKYIVGNFLDGISIQPPPENALDLVPITIFSLPKDTALLAKEQLKAEISEFHRLDDVFCPEFLQGVIFTRTNPNAGITASAIAWLKSLGMKWYRVIGLDAALTLLHGPYVLQHGRLRDVWRLYDDFNGAFMKTFCPNSSSFQSLRVTSSDERFLGVAVASRNQRRLCSGSVMAGARIAIKDNIHLEGVRTSVGNRAFYETFPPQKATATAIQRLIDLGAVIVGTTKLNSFGLWEEPTEYIDYPAPWNPRGDRYQSCGGSSTGSAAAITSYDWLDFAIGTDTWGSCIRPALWCGCFGFRPSKALVSSDGIEPQIRMWDVPGLLGRDLPRCRAFVKEWLDLSPNENPSAFTKILCPIEYWEMFDERNLAVVDRFVNDIEKSLGICHVKVSIESEWNRFPPPEARNISLLNFIHSAMQTLDYDVYHNCDEFRQIYRERYDAEPYVSPPAQAAWSAGKLITREKREAGGDKIAIFKQWFERRFMANENESTLFLLPIENMVPRYRDEPPKFKRPPQDGVHSLVLAPLLDAPELAIPLGHIEFTSKITEKKERLPVALGVMSLPGTDLNLMETMEKVLRDSGRPVFVTTGKSVFGD